MAIQKIIKPGSSEVKNLLHVAAKLAESLNAGTVAEAKKAKQFPARFKKIFH